MCDPTCLVSLLCPVLVSVRESASLYSPPYHYSSYFPSKSRLKFPERYQSAQVQYTSVWLNVSKNRTNQPLPPSAGRHSTFHSWYDFTERVRVIELPYLALRLLLCILFAAGAVQVGGEIFVTFAIRDWKKPWHWTKIFHCDDIGQKVDDIVTLITPFPDDSPPPTRPQRYMAAISFVRKVFSTWCNVLLLLFWFKKKIKLLELECGPWITGFIYPDHVLLDSAANIGPLISCWELDKFKNCWNKSFRPLKSWHFCMSNFQTCKFPNKIWVVQD